MLVELFRMYGAFSVPLFAFLFCCWCSLLFLCSFRFLTARYTSIHDISMDADNQVCLSFVISSKKGPLGVFSYRFIHHPLFLDFLQLQRFDSISHLSLLFVPFSRPLHHQRMPAHLFGSSFTFMSLSFPLSFWLCAFGFLCFLQFVKAAFKITLQIVWKTSPALRV